MTDDLCFRYWGKAARDGNDWHLLPYHCLDVAAIASVWWENSSAIRHSFTQHHRLSAELLKSWLLFFVALHDYGKFDCRFQLRVVTVWRRLDPMASVYHALPSLAECRSYGHGAAGLSWFLEDHAPLTADRPADGEDSFAFLEDLHTEPSAIPVGWLPWIEAVTGHHGHLLAAAQAPDVSFSPLCDRRAGRADQAARKEWLRLLAELFLAPVGVSLDDPPPPCFSPFLAGFCSVCDWLGSRNEETLFPFRTFPGDLHRYFHERREHDAARMLEASGVISCTRKYNGVAALLQAGHKPRSLQTLVDTLPLRPGVSLVEAPTGSGKTEAAFAYAWRLVDAGLADSIIFALPTQATANAMLARLERFAPLLFADGPNLLLAHGSARWNSAFQKLQRAALEGFEQEDGGVQCSQWLAESRKRVFLGQVGVCTIDQVLISVLPVRHRFVRGFGVGRSVLIVDEVHAYDAYMYGLLESVLQQQKAAGGTAILLSATLPRTMRRQLCSAWGGKAEEPAGSNAYPLVSWNDGNDTRSYILEQQQLPAHCHVNLETVHCADMLPGKHLLTRVVTAAGAGAQVVLVCNLVVAAQQLTRLLRTMTNIPVDLFHARFIHAHRRDKEALVMGHFGPKGSRRAGRILVATQVVEQSLDLDFDWMVTQLCPVDLLFQRMGRLHRHPWRKRPAGLETPLCTVLLPIDDQYGAHGRIYANQRVLWRTAEKLTTAPGHRVLFPEAYRGWIEDVYQEEPWERESAGMTEAHRQFVEATAAARARALQLVHSAMNPLHDTDQAVTAATRDGDMNLTVVPFLGGGLGRVLMDGTFFDTLNPFDRPEALSLNSVGVPSSWRRFFGQAEDGRFWLELHRGDEGYSGRSNGAMFSYHKDMGLERNK